MKKICFATNNPNKLREIQQLLGEDFELLSLKDINCLEELPETQDTLEGNSLQKAEYVFDRYEIPVFADDTGLEVAALNGEPGVYSARYAGLQRSADDNMQKLLSALSGVSNRSAQFRTVITYIDEKGKHQFEGVSVGVITHERSGAGGFGYDPIFKPEGKTQTFSEMTAEEKNVISHRGRAIKKLVDFLKQHD